MFNVLNRFAWIIAIIIGISIFSINDELFLIGFLAIVAIKIFVLSESFIKSNILEYNKKLEESILKKLSGMNLNDIKKESFVKDFSNIDENFENDEFFEEKKEKDLSFNEIEKNILKEKLEDIEENEFKNEKLEDIKDNYLQNEELSKKDEIDNEIEEIHEPSKLEKYLKEFFAENLMAKIGGILLAIGIIFLMSLVYREVGEKAKIIIGFAVGFIVYFLGTLLDKKGYKTEGVILLGTGILINYIVILSGQYIIGTNDKGLDGFFSSGITFLFLLLNTVFSVVTSYLYSSKNMLLFSIFFAYLIPLIVRSNDSDYSYLVVVGHSVILTIGALFISNDEFKKGNLTTAKILFYFSVILGNLLVLVSPIKGDFSFITKIIGFNIITFSNIYLAYKNKFTNEILGLFIASFIFLGLILTYGVNELGNSFNTFPIFLTYFVSIIGILGSIVFFITAGIGSSLIYILFAPLILVLGLLFSSSLFGGIFLIPIFLIIYLIIFAFVLGNIVGNIFKYVFFVILGIFLFLCNSYFSSTNLVFQAKDYIAIVFTAILFLGSTYYLSSKKDLSFLYTIGTLASIFILLPIIKITGNFKDYSIFAIIVFGILNYLTPFINKNLVNNDTKNLVLGNIFGILFIGTNLYRFGNVYFSGISLGYAFGGLAILYFVGGYVLFNKLEKVEDDEEIIESNKNFIYIFLGIAISLFSIGVALVFSELPLVIAFIWLVESSIVLFFAQKLKSNKILTAGIILFIIGILRLLASIFGDLVYKDLVSVLFIYIVLVLNVIFTQKIEIVGKIFARILHLIGMFLVFGFIVTILNDHANSGKIFILGISFIFILGVIYNVIKDTFLKNAYIIILSMFFLSHISGTDSINDYNNNYLATSVVALILSSEFIFFRDKKSNIIALIVGIYLFIISSIYLYHITNNAFYLTIYWGILALIGVHTGIGKDLKLVRGVGLVLLLITLVKIVFYDIWYNAFTNDAIIRVVAFIFVGGIMMYISTLYSKNKLSIKEDLSFDLGSEDDEIEKDEIEKNIEEQKTEVEEKDFIINESIKNIDISNIDSIKFKKLDGKSFSIRSKNLFKIIKLVISKIGKTSFKPKELETIYNKIITNYKSDLNESDYKKLLGIMKDFVEIGGEVEILEK